MTVQPDRYQRRPVRGRTHRVLAPVRVTPGLQLLEPCRELLRRHPLPMRTTRRMIRLRSYLAQRDQIPGRLKPGRVKHPPTAEQQPQKMEPLTDTLALRDRARSDRNPLSHGSPSCAAVRRCEPTSPVPRETPAAASETRSPGRVLGREPRHQPAERRLDHPQLLHRRMQNGLARAARRRQPLGQQPLQRRLAVRELARPTQQLELLRTEAQIRRQRVVHPRPQALSRCFQATRRVRAVGPIRLIRRLGLLGWHRAAPPKRQVTDHGRPSENPGEKREPSIARPARGPYAGQGRTRREAADRPRPP